MYMELRELEDKLDKLNRFFLYLNGKRTWHGGQTERNCTNLQISRIISLVKAFIVENTFNDIIMEIKNVSIKNYPILDACCGGRMFYFDKHDSRVLFQDIRDVETTLCDGRHFEVKPDI